MELLDVVDENGNPTGETIERGEAHRRGVRHRTSHVWLLRKHGGKVQVLLQKRSSNKESYPGCFDVSSAGHIPAGYDYQDSALRELREELGVEARASELIFCGRRRIEYSGTFCGQEFHDNQISNIYALRMEREAEDFALQGTEVESVQWMDWDECVDMVKYGRKPHCIWLEELEMVSHAVSAL